MDAVTAGVGTDQQDQVAGASSGSARVSFELLDDADAHGVDEAVVAVELVEVDLATDGGNANAVAVAADAGHDTIEEAPLAPAPRIAEAQ